MVSHALWSRPIGPLRSVVGWKSLPITECGEPLVPLGMFGAYPQIGTDAIYFGERTSSPYPPAALQGSLLSLFVRQGVATRLAQASSLLPPMHMLLVWDAYRPITVQRALFDYYVGALEGKKIPHEQAVLEAQTFVSLPSDDPTRPSPHNTGGAVDVSIIRFDPDVWVEMENLHEVITTSFEWDRIHSASMWREKFIREEATLLDMGTPFDSVQPETKTRFYEEVDSPLLGAKDLEARNNRRLLWNVMTAAGFANYCEEWWHFDFGNQFAAASAGQAAIYATAIFSSENASHEAMRRMHYEANRAFSEGGHPGTVVRLPLEVYGHLRCVAAQVGNPRVTNHASAVEI